MNNLQEAIDYDNMESSCECALLKDNGCIWIQASEDDLWDYSCERCNRNRDWSKQEFVRRPEYTNPYSQTSLGRHFPVDYNDYYNFINNLYLRPRSQSDINDMMNDIKKMTNNANINSIRPVGAKIGK